MPLDGTAHDLEHLAGYRGVGPVHHPWVAPGMAVHKTSLLLDVLERPNPAPPAVDGPKRSPRSSSLIFRTPTGSPCGLLRPSPAADRRARRAGPTGVLLREFSRLRPRAARAGAFRSPRGPRKPWRSSRARFGYGECSGPPPFSVPQSSQVSGCAGRGHRPLFFGMQRCNRPPFLGFALRLPRLGRAPGGVLKNAKVRPDVRPPRAQRPGRPFLSRNRRLRPTRLRGGC